MAVCFSSCFYFNANAHIIRRNEIEGSKLKNEIKLKELKRKGFGEHNEHFMHATVTDPYKQRQMHEIKEFLYWDKNTCWSGNYRSIIALVFMQISNVQFMLFNLMMFQFLNDFLHKKRKDVPNNGYVIKMTMANGRHTGQLGLTTHDFRFKYIYEFMNWIISVQLIHNERMLMHCNRYVIS